MRASPILKGQNAGVPSMARDTFKGLPSNVVCDGSRPILSPVSTIVDDKDSAGLDRPSMFILPGLLDVLVGVS